MTNFVYAKAVVRDEVAQMVRGHIFSTLQLWRVFRYGRKIRAFSVAKENSEISSGLWWLLVFITATDWVLLNHFLLPISS